MRMLTLSAAFSLVAGPATSADGLTTSNQPFLNGTNNSAPTADAVPGQG